jgi:protein O-GlcNAc transferase
VLTRLGRWLDAESACRRAVELDCRFAEAHNNLGIALKSLGRLAEAEAALKAALSLQPSLSQAEANLAAVLREQSRAEEASVHYWRAIELGLADRHFHSNALSCEQYLPGIAPRRLADLHAHWNQRHAAHLKAVSRLPVQSGQSRPIRLGFVSPDLSRHPVTSFLVGVLEHLATDDCSAYCYSDSLREDEVSQRIRHRAASWLPSAKLSDEGLAARIAADEIEILFDLAGHTAGNRLLTFARRPAPVQVSWIGYPSTTGLTAFDYILADRNVIPPGAEGDYCERVLRMPHVYACYTPPDDAPPISPLPALQTGNVIFGSFNNPLKIGPRVITHAAPPVDLRIPHLEQLQHRIERRASDQPCLYGARNISMPLIQPWNQLESVSLSGIKPAARSGAPCRNSTVADAGMFGSNLSTGGSWTVGSLKSTHDMIRSPQSLNGTTPAGHSS